MPPRTPLAAWATSGGCFNITRTADKLSLVVEVNRVPDGLGSEPGEVVLKLHGPFDFALTGVLAEVLDPLAAAGVGIFAISTFDTDDVLVKRSQPGMALTALRAAGHGVAP